MVNELQLTLRWCIASNDKIYFRISTFNACFCDRFGNVIENIYSRRLFPMIWRKPCKIYEKLYKAFREKKSFICLRKLFKWSKRDNASSRAKQYFSIFSKQKAVAIRYEIHRLFILIEITCSDVKTTRGKFSACLLLASEERKKEKTSICDCAQRKVYFSF